MFNHPLYLHGLSLEELNLMIEILHIARWECRLISAHEFSETSSVGPKIPNLDRIIGQKEKRSIYGANNDQGRPMAFEKVCRLYNFTMGELPDIIEAHRRRRKHVDDDISAKREILAEKIKALYQLGVESGRYEFDMHVNNANMRFINTANQELDNRILNKSYLSMRKRSDGKAFVCAWVYIFKDGERYKFRSQILDPQYQREVIGFAYQVGQVIYLFGTINSDGNSNLSYMSMGMEFSMLRFDDMRADLLFGIMSTISKDGSAHSKHCVLVNSQELTGFADANMGLQCSGNPEKASDAESGPSSDWRGRATSLLADGFVALHWKNGNEIDLHRHIDGNVVSMMNTGYAPSAQSSPDA